MWSKKNTPKTTAFLRVLMHVRNFYIAMKRELKMNTQNTRSGMYLCVHFQRYLCANVEDRDTKRERFFAPESRERRETCVFEFLKRRRGEKKFKKNSKTHNRRSLSSLDFLSTTKQRNFTVLLRADDRVKIHSQTSNDIRNQFSKDQIQRAVDEELLQAFEIKNVMDFSPAIFLLFFLFSLVVLKKTDTREKKHTTTHRKTLFLSLRNNINTLRTNTEEKAFFFSLVFLLSRRFQRESCIHIPLSLKKKRERSR